MDYRIIKSPSEGTKRIIMNRVSLESRKSIKLASAIGLVHGKFIDMIYAVDIAEKFVGVSVDDIKGSCPQHMVSIVIWGDTASVEVALSEIKSKVK